MISRSFGTSVLVIVGLFSLLTAWNSGFAPHQFARRLGLMVTNADGYNEIRAQYAGFFLVTGAMCIAALSGFAARRPVLILLAVLFGGLLTGRLASLVLNRGFAGYGPTILALYVIDAAGFALTAIAVFLDRKT